MNELKQAVSRLSKSNTGFDATLELAIVQSVNEAEMTCDVVLFDNEDLLLEGVKLKPVVAGLDLTEMGAVLYPEVGSQVIIGQINNQDTDLFVVLAGKANKISLDAGDSFRMLMDIQNGEVSLEAIKIVFNQGLKGGLPMVKPLLLKINQLEEKLNALTEDFKAHKHIGVTTGAGISGFGTKLDSSKIEPMTLLTDIENTQIKQ